MENTTNTTAAPVKVEQILSTRNPEIFQLMLRQEVEKPAEANPLGFFLEGYPGVGDSVERRVAYQTVSKQFIEKYDITEDCDFAIAITSSKLEPAVAMSAASCEYFPGPSTTPLLGVSNPEVIPSALPPILNIGLLKVLFIMISLFP